MEDFKERAQELLDEMIELHEDAKSAYNELLNNKPEFYNVFSMKGEYENDLQSYRDLVERTAESVRVQKMLVNN